MGLSAYVQMLPLFFRKDDTRGGDLRVVGEKKGDQFFAEFLDAFGGGISRERIDRVFHRVGGKNLAVVSGGKAGLEITLEPNLDGPFTEIVMSGDAASLLRGERAICRNCFRRVRS